MNIPDIYLPYRFYGFDPAVLKNKLLLDLSCCNLVETDKVMAAWRDLPWDSKHFDYKMLELKYFITEEDASFKDRCTVMRELHKDWQGYDHVTARINAFDILSAQVAENLGFSLMDTNVKYGIDLRKASLQKFEGSKFTKEGAVYEVIRCPCHLPELIHIAETSWSQTKVTIDRFHADRNFSQKLADSVYTEWLQNSLTGELADYVILPRVKGKAAGFLTLKQHADSVEDTNIGLLVLAAVDPSMRGKKIYTNMISLGLRVLKREAEIAETGTQSTNYPVQKAWVRLGLKLVSTTYVFHKRLTR
ncbi:MAG: hypothetical protein OEZ21_02725 [Candidatus Bathyarchaeota archaeon]|nr:hypothetical protein [Candidatus Bathyarchaeota archaeon]MDH5745861.1 hypothetical protein [Candidatus Bathyarchaeota archaeon]